MKEDITQEIGLTEGVTVTLEGLSLTVKGPKGEISREFAHPRVEIKMDGGKVILSATKGTQREKKLIATFTSHIRNMIAGVVEPHLYKLKICSGHFPMNVSVSGQNFTVKNFLGEAVPRKVMMPEGVKIKVEGTEVIITSSDKEIAGKAAARVEQLCRITDRDRRIFQDGIYMIHKAGKDIV